MEPPPKQTDPNAHPWRTVTENAEAQLALTRALDSGRWTAAEVIAVLEGGPKRKDLGPPMPEEILEAGERLAGMVAMVWPADPFARENAMHAARMAAGHLRRRADAFRSPG